MTHRRRDTIVSTLPRLDQFDFHAHIARISGPALVVFTSPDCGSCHHLRQVLSEVRSREPGWCVFEVDAQTESGLTNEFEVFHLPTIFLYNDGQFHCQLDAEARPLSIISTTHKALRAPATEAP